MSRSLSMCPGCSEMWPDNQMESHLEECNKYLVEEYKRKLLKTSTSILSAIVNNELSDLATLSPHTITSHIDYSVNLAARLIDKIENSKYNIKDVKKIKKTNKKN